MRINRRNFSTRMEVNESIVAEPLEVALARMKEKNEMPENVRPLIYTDRRDGVKPGYNIRTDRFETMRETAGKLDKARRYKEANEEAKTVEAPPKTELKEQD